MGDSGAPLRLRDYNFTMQNGLYRVLRLAVLLALASVTLAAQAPSQKPATEPAAPPAEDPSQQGATTFRMRIDS